MKKPISQVFASTGLYPFCITFANTFSVLLNIDHQRTPSLGHFTGEITYEGLTAVHSAVIFN